MKHSPKEVHLAVVELPVGVGPTTPLEATVAVVPSTMSIEEVVVAAAVVVVEAATTTLLSAGEVEVEEVMMTVGEEAEVGTIAGMAVVVDAIKNCLLSVIYGYNIAFALSWTTCVGL